MTENIKCVGIIPARWGSSRLPGKPLADICGKPLIRHVWEAVTESETLKNVIIATDDERIFDACKSFGAEAVMTPSELQSGTDRIEHAFRESGIEADVVVNIQGDEPLIKGRVIDEMLSSFVDSGADVGTLIKKISDTEQLLEPSVVKVVLGSNNLALYFSRSPVPHLRDWDINEWPAVKDYWHHIGVYAYPAESLRKFVSLPQSRLEKSEKLEQLRLLETGAKYFCHETDLELIGVDNPEDLELVRKIMAAKA